MEPYEAEQQRLDVVLEKIQDAKVKNDLDRQNNEQKQADVEAGWNDVAEVIWALMVACSKQPCLFANNNKCCKNANWP